MWRFLDQATAALILLVGCVHVAVARRAFLEPNEDAVWFMSAGLLGIAAGLSNLARARAVVRSRLAALAAAAGSGGLLTVGALLAVSGAVGGPQAYVVLVLCGVSLLFGLRDLVVGAAGAEKIAR